MKDNGAEELIRSKIGAEESGSGLLEDNDVLWSALSQRLDKKKSIPKVRLRIYWAAASLLLLLMAGLWRYPAQQTGGGQQAVRLPPPETSNKALPGGQETKLPAVQEAQQPKEEIVAQVGKTAPVRKRKIKEPEKKEQNTATENAGLYAMPQIACAEVPIGNYPLCSQTL